MYAWWPTCYLHPLGLGGTFGETIRLRQNNATTYKPFDRYVGGVPIALMGDPTLRLFAVKPPSALTLGTDSGHRPVLTWAASTDSPLLGYHVYRGVDERGPFRRLTSDPLTQTMWTDESVVSGTFTYQVKAAKLEVTPSGTFVNTSQAVAATITTAAHSGGSPVAGRSSPGSGEVGATYCGVDDLEWQGCRNDSSG